jgi:hypothetical protein
MKFLNTFLFILVCFSGCVSTDNSDVIAAAQIQEIYFQIAQNPSYAQRYPIEWQSQYSEKDILKAIELYKENVKNTTYNNSEIIKAQNIQIIYFRLKENKNFIYAIPEEWYTEFTEDEILRGIQLYKLQEGSDE